MDVIFFLFLCLASDRTPPSAHFQTHRPRRCLSPCPHEGVRSGQIGSGPPLIVFLCQMARVTTLNCPRQVIWQRRSGKKRKSRQIDFQILCRHWPRLHGPRWLGYYSSCQSSSIWRVEKKKGEKNTAKAYLSLATQVCFWSRWPSPDRSLLLLPGAHRGPPVDRGGFTATTQRNKVVKSGEVRSHQTSDNPPPTMKPN